MITVTLGTIPYPFDRVTNWLDSLIREGIITEPVCFQHGSTNADVLAKHKLVTSVPLLPMSELAEQIEVSRFVISHAGQGSTRMLAARNNSFVIVPRLSKYSEHVDDHQLLFAKGVEQLGVHICVTLESLKLAIKQPPTPLNKDLFAGNKLCDYLAEKYPGRVPVPTINEYTANQV